MKENNNPDITEASVLDIARSLNTCKGNYAFLIGAGTSKSAGIETSSELIEQWKKEKYSEIDPESNLETWIESIEENRMNGRSEYGFWFEERYTTKGERRKFIEERVMDKSPTFGHIVLASLMNENYVELTLTPNFDDLLYDSFYLFLEQRPMLIDHNAIATQFQLTRNKPTIIKLHGDYLYNNLKNIDQKHLN